MKRNKKRIIAAIAVIGALAAGGAAFTAANTIPASVAGYGTSTISGATATNIHYVLNGDGTQITGVNLTFQGDLTNSSTTNVPDTVEAGFEANNLTACTVGTYDSTNHVTPYTCTGFTESTSSSASLNVAVTN